MQDIQTKAITTYQNNLNYFQEKHPEIYKKIDLLSQALEQGSYKENYSLEYKDNAFNILDKNTNQYLYNDQTSIEHAKEMAQGINYKKNEGVIETFYNYNFSKEAVEYANQEDPTISRFVLTAPIIQFSKDLIDKDHTIMKKIYKFIFFGVGLGLHITEIHKKIDSSMYMIIEDNLELFRLSLFVTDYQDIAKNSELYFSIMENNDTFKEIFEHFYHNSFIRNNYIKFSLFYPNYKSKISDIQTFIVTQSNLTYQHDKLLLKNSNVLYSIKEKYKFFNISEHYKHTPFSEKPLILVAAGPSLNKEILWLKENAPYAIVVALFMTLPILEKHDIKPDIIFHVDENMEIIDKNIQKIQDLEFFKESFFFLAPSIKCSHFLEIAKKENIYLFEDRTRYRFTKGFIEAFSVGEVSYALSLLWDTQELYLLGLDLALDPETKQTHADGHASHKKDKNSGLTKLEDSETVVSLRGSELTIKGNFRPTVSTTPLFDMSRIMLNNFTQKYKQPNQNIYNLNDGAYFIDTIPTHTKDISLKNQEKNQELYQQIQNFFDTNAEAELDKKEILGFNFRLKDAYEKREMILEFSKRKAPTIEQFRTSFTKMAVKLIENPENGLHELTQTYITYLENIGGYIGDFFNTSNLPNPKRNIKQFQKIIAEQLLKIVNRYIEDLQRVDIKEIS
jgi:hypothetical protein